MAGPNGKIGFHRELILRSVVMAASLSSVTRFGLLLALLPSSSRRRPRNSPSGRSLSKDWALSVRLTRIGSAPCTQAHRLDAIARRRPPAGLLAPPAYGRRKAGCPAAVPTRSDEGCSALMQSHFKKSIRQRLGPTATERHRACFSYSGQF